MTKHCFRQLLAIRHPLPTIAKAPGSGEVTSAGMVLVTFLGMDSGCNMAPCVKRSSKHASCSLVENSASAAEFGESKGDSSNREGAVYARGGLCFSLRKSRDRESFHLLGLAQVQDEGPDRCFRILRTRTTREVQHSAFAKDGTWANRRWCRVE